MYNEADISLLLTKAGIRLTANRLMVVHELVSHGQALSLRELETHLLTMDRSSIFRVLQTLSAHALLHEIDDGSGAVKYELCSEPDHDAHGQHDDEHIHFFCQHCRRTFCLTDQPVPHVDLPNGFMPHSANFVIRGLCPECYERDT